MTPISDEEHGQLTEERALLDALVRLSRMIGCTECGVPVIDREAHEAWHLSLAAATDAAGSDDGDVQAVLDFLDGIDPGMLAALAFADDTLATNPTEAILATLRRVAAGQV